MNSMSRRSAVSGLEIIGLEADTSFCNGKIIIVNMSNIKRLIKQNN